MQAAEDVEAGLAGCLEAAFSQRYSTLQATFLASALYQMAGSDFNLLSCVNPALWQAAAAYSGEAALAEALLGCYDSKTLPELHRLQGLSWTLSHHGQTDKPLQCLCPCFAAISAALNTAKVTQNFIAPLVTHLLLGLSIVSHAQQ